MKSFDLSIYGNLILDRVLHLQEFPREGIAQTVSNTSLHPGASANVAAAYYKLTGTKPQLFSFVGSDPDGAVCIETLSRYCEASIEALDRQNTSTAVILDSLHRSSRTGLVSWGACTDMSTFTETLSKWKHFCYIDKLNNLDKQTLKNMSGLKSADLTSFDYDDQGRARIMNAISEIDYVVTAKEEAGYLIKSDDIEEIATKIGSACKSYVILHDPKGSYLCDGNYLEYVSAEHDVLSGISVLGAGDIFAAAFIANHTPELTLKNILIKSHNSTYEILKERK